MTVDMSWLEEAYASVALQGHRGFTVCSLSQIFPLYQEITIELGPIFYKEPVLMDSINNGFVPQYCPRQSLQYSNGG